MTERAKIRVRVVGPTHLSFWRVPRTEGGYQR